ncbi:MAG: PorT family protein [Chitinophagaceae bacterium]|nr:PorT family protein [Chitinophagaceae bacterium]
MQFKRLGLIMVFTLGMIQGFAQFRVGPVGGLNFKRQVFKSNTYRFDALFKERLGFNLGVMSEIVMTKNLSLQSELLFTQRGGYYKTEGVNISEEFTSDLSYVSLPLCLTYKLDVRSAWLIAGAGPYLEKLIHSSHKYYSNGVNIENGPMRVGNSFYTDQLKPWSAGVKVKAGFELRRGMYMVAYYDIGTSDINPQFTVTRNKTYGIQWSYIFSTTEEDRYNRLENFYEF